MKHNKSVACMLAALFCAVPFAACSAPEKGEADLPPEEIEIVPPIEEPELPPITEEEPERPVRPELPALPKDPEESDDPDLDPEPDPDPEPEPEPQDPTSEYVKILTNGLNVRSGAGTQYKSLGTVENQILLKYMGKTGNWYITYYRGSVAYVSAGTQYTSLTTLKTGSEAVERVIEEGLKYMGVPYVYGAVRYHDGNGNLLSGFTESKFDCSSLMQYIFYKGAGVNLQVTTRTQIFQGKEVQKSDIQRGDLLFFTNSSRVNKTGIERVGHVALYLGDNFILHTASDYAKVEQISAQRWSYYITARRVL